MDLTIKPVNRNLKEYSDIKELILKSFPKNEQYPLWLLRLLALREKINFSAYYDDNIFCGITYSISNEDTTFLLYLAVNDKIRSRGYGSRILACLRERLKNNKIVFNIEKTDINADNNKQREKRLNFYLKNGFHKTDYELVEKDEIYSILCSDRNFVLKDYNTLIKKLSFGTYTGKIRKVEELER